MAKIITQSYYSNRKLRKGYNPNIRKKVVRSAIQEIIKVVKERSNKPVSQLIVLDAGSGTGEYAFEIEKHVKEVIGVEPFKPAFEESKRKAERAGSKVKFYNDLVESFHTKRKFDLVISLTTVEHMPNAEESFKKILNLMNKRGLIYLTAPNKLWPYDNHYKLPFLPWLPLKVANKYVQITKRGDSYRDSAYSRTYWGMKRLFDKLGCKYEFFVPSEKLDYIGCGESGVGYNFVRSVGIKLVKRFPLFWVVSKGFIMVVEKK